MSRKLPTSTLVTAPTGQGREKPMPGCSVPEYQPKVVTTPFSFGPTRWIEVKASHSTTAMMIP